MSSKSPKEIERSAEVLTYLTGLTMDKKDMISKKYKYRFEQFSSGEIHTKHIRCMDCFVLESSTAAKRRYRLPTEAEKEEARRERTCYYDFWPEYKTKPMILTSGGTIIPSDDPRQPFIFRKDFPKLDQKLDQYYPAGYYAKAMEKPRHKIQQTDDNRHSLVPEWTETPLLGKEMDPNKPCYTMTNIYKNFEIMEWWRYYTPLTWSDYIALRPDINKVPQASCIGHPGKVGSNRKWTCCGRWPDSPGCRHARGHRFPDINADREREIWHLYPTPDPSVAVAPRTAVALSCETGIATDGSHEIIRIGMIDFFTGEVLINKLVFPTEDVKMLHLNTRWSGVDYQMLHVARAMKNVLEGRDAARNRVWDFVGPDTIIITYAGGTRDLLDLRLIHRKVIDLEELESRRDKSDQINLWKGGLRNLVSAHLQRKYPSGSHGNVIETAIALRDLTRWYMNNLPPVMKTKVDTSRKCTDEELRLAAEFRESTREIFGEAVIDEDYRFCLQHNYPREGGEWIRPEMEEDFNPPIVADTSELWG